MRLRKCLAALLALCLLSGLIPAVMAEDEIQLDGTGEGQVILGQVANEEAILPLDIDNAITLDGAIDLQAQANDGQPVSNYTSGNLAHFVQPKDGDVLPQGKVDIYLTYDDDGVWDASGGMLSEGEIYDNYMPTLLSVEKDGVVDVTTIRDNHITFNGENQCYATVTLNEAGVYRLGVASSRGTDNPEVITVTVTDPGYHLIPEKTEYTINLAYEKRVRFNFTIESDRQETDIGWGFSNGGDEVIDMVDKDHSELTLVKRGDKYVCDTFIVFEGTGVGTGTINICVGVNGVEYDAQTITFHVINDPDLKPTPEPTARPTAAPERVNLSRCSARIKDQTYSGKALKPAVTVQYDGKALTKGTDYTVTYKNNKAVGTATATLTGKGMYTGTKKVSFKILPPKVALTGLKAGAKSFTATWKKGTANTGYQLQYALKKSFSGAKTVKVAKAKTLTATVKALNSGKTYYVRVRAYRTVNKNTYYSAWSSARSVKVK